MSSAPRPAIAAYIPSDNPEINTTPALSLVVDEAIASLPNSDSGLNEAPQESRITDDLLATLPSDQTLAFFGEINIVGSHTNGWADQIRNSEVRTADGIRLVRRVNYVAGACRNLDRWHTSTLIEESLHRPELFGDVVLVQIGEQVVGSIKMAGEQSMLALNNVQDSDGKLQIVAGGVYVAPQEVVDEAIFAFNMHGKWARIKLDRLDLQPLRFLNIPNPEEIDSIAQTISDIKDVVSRLEDERI